jgi:hypothetical protein
MQELLLPQSHELSMLAGLAATYSNRHRARVLAEAARVNTQLQSVLVETVTLAEVAGMLGTQTPDLLMIDVEGAELDVLQSADWGTFRPRVILLESNYGASAELRYLSKLGYRLLWRVGWDRVFVDITISKG